MFTGQPSEWDLPPPDDPEGAARSAAIDAWLRQERAKDLRRGSRTLILSPDTDESNALRERLFGLLGSEVDIDYRGQQGTTSISTIAVGRKDRKRLSESSQQRHGADPTNVMFESAAGMEPSMLVYTVDPGEEGHRMLHNLQKALSHFLFTCRNLGLGPGCVAIVLVARSATVAENAANGSTRQDWVNLFPTLPTVENDLLAVQNEFVAAAKMGSDPLEVLFYSDIGTFDQAEIVRQHLKQAYSILMDSLQVQMSSIEEEEDDLFHDTDQPPSSTNEVAPISAPTPLWYKDYRVIILGILPAILAAIVAILWGPSYST